MSHGGKLPAIDSHFSLLWSHSTTGLRHLRVSVRVTPSQYGLVVMPCTHTQLHRTQQSALDTLNALMEVLGHERTITAVWHNPRLLTLGAARIRSAIAALRQALGDEAAATAAARKNSLLLSSRAQTIRQVCAALCWCMFFGVCVCVCVWCFLR